MDSLHKKVKGEDLLLEKNVIDIFACITQGPSEEVYQLVDIMFGAQGYHAQGHHDTLEFLSKINYRSDLISLITILK